ncbi:peptidase C14 [Artomyces pyxidatus]|uniref:Peptidase C14 n=1 Tax=Artomyces pyxidatus TaxID=48021 RepID=A0ACB8SHM6_9AGAM|nr:peptidase C14 [Artomyces pyxidatus]
MEHPQFQYSRCTGRRKGLCIGVNYIGQNSELHGCINDAKEAYQFIIDKYHYDQADVMLLTDDAEDERNLPTRENIVSAMHWLLEGAQMHDSLFIHYSGHGGWSKDRNRDKGYGFDEMIFPVDYKKAGTILDDDLHDYLVGPLPPGCRLTAVFDSCHSASVLDLTYRYHSDGHAKRLRLSSRFLDERSTPGDVLCWSGSKDDQDSADASVGGLSVGAMSYAFLKVLKSKPDITYEDLLRGLRRETKKYQQKPQLSASHRMDIDRKFVM